MSRMPRFMTRHANKARQRYAEDLGWIADDFGGDPTDGEIAAYNAKKQAAIVERSRKLSVGECARHPGAKVLIARKGDLPRQLICEVCDRWIVRHGGEHGWNTEDLEC